MSMMELTNARFWFSMIAPCEMLAKTSGCKGRFKNVDYVFIDS
jgi:hypothetical protein